MSEAPQVAIPIQVALRWSDQDLLGHVNNAKIMTLVEEARIRALTQIQHQVGWEGPLEMVLRTATTDFLRPVMYTDHVVVNVWVSKVGRTSFVLQHQLVQDGVVCATVEAVMVVFDSKQQTSVPIPESIRAAFQEINA